MAFATINKGASYFNTVLYTGNDASNRAITGVNFKPDLVWLKSRSNAFNHYLTDAVRGAGYIIYSNLTNAQVDGTAAFKSFDTDGFTLTQEAGYEINKSAVTYATWNWLGANSTTTNTSGTITSTVSANTTSGFSIVSYTGNGTAGATVGHGLGAVPKMIIVKNRSADANWKIYHVSLGATKAIIFGTTGAETEIYPWNNTSPTSSVFSLGTTPETNSNGASIIAYCFADVKGYSKFGSYTGNGSADGTFIYTGFKPAYVGFKKSSAAGTNWVTSNNKVNTYNAVDAYLHQNTSGTESTGSRDIDFLSNGFKIRNSNSTWNESGATFIYMSFAENPFVLTDGTPVTAR
jgi:hypothetical protein